MPPKLFILKIFNKKDTQKACHLLIKGIYPIVEIKFR
ncbi:hypothetical protein CHY_0580 [Carboxydothermus hydrogenoformans Z-2901]|uniref:Uncharacterized protein n=1 Tax=Carboxydothermus hydrogenoformans (strain ATCC BAA-161 / DSM 6008 / Z-2901) TaxID=246194 RepID=Q3AEJ8_CARHZ|nr:hypothetical protein CHY_0580 [Carboxydothermus hydrogenoformans Z-2901]